MSHSTGFFKLLLAALSVAGLAGCSWESVQRSVLGSIYSAYGEGYSTDRLSDFDQRYEQQTQAATEYYQQR